MSALFLMIFQLPVQERIIIFFFFDLSAKTTAKMSMNPGGKMWNKSRNNPFNFDADPDKGVNPGFTVAPFYLFFRVAFHKNVNR